MVQINFALREVNVKIVYYGPGRSGKTTNLEVIHSKAPKDSIGEMMSIATETDRTLFFDFLPLDLGKVAGMNTKFQLYTVPGQVYYKATRKLVLQGADGVVFVADSQQDMMDENIQSLSDLEENLRENGLDIANLPLVFQWNKRDLDNIADSAELNTQLNRWNAPAFDAIAIKGDGVFQTLKALASTVIQKLNREHGYGDGSGGQAKAPAQPAAPAAPAAPPAPKVAADAQELAAELSAGAAPAQPAPPPKPAQPAPPPQPKPAASAPPKPPAPAPEAPPPTKPQAPQPPQPKPQAEAPAPKPAPPSASAPPPPPKPAAPAPKPAAPPVPPKPAASAPPPPATKPVAPEKLIRGTAPTDTEAKIAPPPPSAAAKPKPSSRGKPSAAHPNKGDPGRIDTEDLNPVSRELRRHREERERKQKEQMERIKRSARKPLKKEGVSPALIIVGVVIFAAIGAILFYVLGSS